MKRIIVSEITVIFWLLLFGSAASMDYQTPWDLCENNTVGLNFQSSITLAENFLSSPIIRCIYISSTNIDISEGAFNGLPNLTHLKINNLQLNNLDMFSEILNLRVLTLRRLDDRNYYDHGSVILTKRFPQLEYLDLSGQFISELNSNWIYSFPKLTHLNLSRNGLSSFWKAAETDLPLRTLDLSYNMLSECSLNNLHNLSSLILNNNEIKTIGYGGLDLSNLTNLKNLSLVGNDIQMINRGVFNGLVNLQYLDLSENRLYVFNYELSTTLKVLVLDKNYLSDVPTGVFPNLTTLSLNCNNIGYLTSSSFFNVPHLKKLFLRKNNITEFQVDTFTDTELLEELYLSDNRLSYMPAKWCQSLKKLRHLDLSRNHFTSFDSVFHTCSNFSIKELYFEGNPITYINAKPFQTISKDTVIYLNIGKENEKTSCDLKPFSPMI